jgi:hypothetical protein
MLKTQEPATRAYVVLRAICIQGARVEPGASLQLTKPIGTELAAASKVALEGTDAANAAVKAAKAAAKAAKAVPADPAPTEEPAA